MLKVCSATYEEIVILLQLVVFLLHLMILMIQFS